MNDKTLIVLIGPTGVGKTAMSISLAKKFNTSIISSDSRQIYKELHIGTASPSNEQLQQVKHYFIKSKSIFDYYSAGQYELDVDDLLKKLFIENPVQLLVGGSMLYVDAVCNGLDNIPHSDERVRKDVLDYYVNNGLEGIQKRLLELDPEYYKVVDLKNIQRILHAIEVSIQIKKPYSSLLHKQSKKNAFNILKIGLNLPRETLFERINLRVDQMIKEGLEEEAKNLYKHRNLNSLNTVGYKELFAYFDGVITREEAIEKIKINTRRYAKRQLTWFQKQKDICWFRPDDYLSVEQYIISRL